MALKRGKKKQEEQEEPIVVEVVEGAEFEEETTDEVEGEEPIEQVETGGYAASLEEPVADMETQKERRVKVLVLQDTQRFFYGAGYHEALLKDEVVKLEKEVAEHLQNLGRVRIV